MSTRAAAYLCLVPLLLGCVSRGWGWYPRSSIVKRVSVSRSVDAPERLVWKVQFSNGHADEGQLALDPIFPSDCATPELWAHTLDGDVRIGPGRWFR